MPNLSMLGRLRRIPFRWLSTTPPSNKRVLGAIAHINSGKTTTSEAMLHHAGALRRMGNVDSGDTEMDFLPAERERGITISSAATAFDYYNHQFFLVDSPGHLDFTYEVERALRVMDGVVVLLDAVAGVQPQTETVWRQADRNSLARIVFVNKMDREGADFSNTVEMVRKAFGAVPVVLQVPIFEEGTRRFCGVFDLLELSQGGNGGLRGRDANEEDYVGSYNDLSPMQKVAVEEAFDSVAECVAEVNDDIMGLWLDGKPLPKSIMVEAIRKACICGKLVPVLCGSSLRGIGVESLMQSVINFLPSPLERSPVHAQSLKGDDVVVSASAGQFLAYAFKVTHDKHRGRLVHLRAFSGELLQSRNPFLNTTKRKTESATKLLRILADKNVEIDHVEAGDIFAAVGLKHTATGDTLVLHQTPTSNHAVLDRIRPPPAVYSIAVSVDTNSQETALEEALVRVVDEDASLETRIDTETGEMLLSGMGELHLQVAVDRLTRALPFEIHCSKPRVAYRETASSDGERIEVLNTTIGSAHLSASLSVSIRPIEGDNVVDVSGFSGDDADAIKEGAHAALGRGAMLGAPVTSTHLHISRPDDGESSSQSSAAALRTCTSKAVTTLLRDCSPTLLEPVMRVTCRVPDSSSGEVLSELSHPIRRRGIVEGVEACGDGWNNVSAIVPVEGLLGWSTRMRSMTKGRGDFEAIYENYRAVDAATQKRILAERSGV